MSKLSQIFKEIGEIELPKELRSSIFKRIEIEKNREEKRKLFLSYAGLYSSVFATSYAFFYFGSSFLKSEFWNMFSLLFSDLMIVAGNWKTYGYSLLETLPVLHLAAILVPMLALILSVNLFLSVRNKMRNIHQHGNLKFV